MKCPRWIVVALSLAGGLAVSRSDGAPIPAAWANAYGGSGLDSGYSVAATSDGGYAVLGSQSSFGSAKTCLCDQFWLVKLDAGGTPQWQETYALKERTEGYSLAQTADGGYVLAGWASTPGSANGDYQVWVLKVDPVGRVLWQREYGLGKGSAVYGQISVRQTADRGYVVAGTKIAPLPEAALVLRLNANGSIRWTKTLAPSGASYSSAYSVAQAADGGFVVAGESIYGASGAWITKLDAEGDVVWQRLYGSPSSGMDIYYAYAIEPTSDGGFVVAGETGPYSYEYVPNAFFAMRLDANGNVIWQKKYGGYSFASGKSVRQTTDGGFVFAGWVMYYGFGYDAWILKTDSNGEVAWQKAYGDDEGYGPSVANSIVEAADGGYVFAGWTQEYGAGSYDFWVVKLDSTGSIPGCDENGADSNAIVTNLSLTVSDVASTPAGTAQPMRTASRTSATAATQTTVCP